MRRSHTRLAVLTLALTLGLALGLAGCGRKAPLEVPPAPEDTGALIG